MAPDTPYTPRISMPKSSMHIAPYAWRLTQTYTGYVNVPVPLSKNPEKKVKNPETH